MPDEHKIHPPDISDERLAKLGKMAGEKKCVLEWVSEEASSSSAEIPAVDFPTRSHPASADRPPGDFSVPERPPGDFFVPVTRRKMAVSFLENEPFDSSNPEGKA